MSPSPVLHQVFREGRIVGAGVLVMVI
jgi:hypothetical protein